MNENKTFLQNLYEALEAEETRDHDTDPTRGAEDFFLATDPPGGGEAENSASRRRVTYVEEASKALLPEKNHKASFSVGDPPLPLAKPRVEHGVCNIVPDGPQKLLELLQEIARSTIPYGNRELWRKVGTVVLMIPLEMLALNLGVTRQTVYRWKKVLEKKGLVATDVLHEKVGGEWRSIGTLWAVRLRPGKARLTLDDYIWPWRNLAVDISNGVLSYSWVRAFEEKGVRPTLDVLVLWAQGKRVMPNTKSVAIDLGIILVLPELESPKIPALITLLAKYIADILDDHRSRRFYAGVLWSVVRGEIPAQYLFALLTRVIRDYLDGHLIRPGAYLVKTLKNLQKEAS